MSKFVSSLLVTSALSLKVGVFSDIHLNALYNPLIAANNCGHTASTIIGDPVAQYGRYGCDSSQMLVEAFFTRFKEQFGYPDVIMVPGDVVAHGTSVPDDKDPDGTVAYQNVKNNIAAVNALLEKHFPNTIVLLTIGNNDGRYHDEAIDEDDKTEYYSFLYNLWFNELTGNKGLSNDTVKSDVLAGGYYAVNIPNTNYTVINMNAMYCDAEDTGKVHPHDGEAEL